MREAAQSFRRCAIYRDAAAAIDWPCEALGFERKKRCARRGQRESSTPRPCRRPRSCATSRLKTMARATTCGEFRRASDAHRFARRAPLHPRQGEG